MATMTAPGPATARPNDAPAPSAEEGLPVPRPGASAPVPTGAPAGGPGGAMSSALSKLPGFFPAGAFSGMGDIFKQPAVKKSMPIILAVLVLMLFGAMFLWIQTPSPHWRVLMPGINETDRQAALEALKAGRFEAKVDPENGNLIVPPGRYHEARMLLASQGLPKGAVAGGLDSLKGQSAMTTSQFMEQVRFNAAIEQELARSVMTISTIKAARVHLAMPRQSPFIRERIAPKASVVVTPHQGRMVSPAQVKAIVQLISSSVPYLPAENVSVVDDDGNLLSDAPSEAAMGLTNAQLQHKRQVEREYRTRITQILGPVVGEHNVKAQVDIRLDFTQQEVTFEDFDSRREGPKTRSEVLAEERTARPDAQGIPGSLSNQPPPDARFSPNASATPEPVATAGSLSKRSTRNFELDRTVRHIKNPTGTIERMSVAVVIHDPSAQEGAQGGKPARFSANEIERLTELVRGTIGFDDKRGDVVTLVTAKFEPVAAAGPPVAWYESETLIGAIKSSVAALVFVMILLFIVRPVMRAFLPAPVAVPDPKLAGLLIGPDGKPIVGPDGKPLDAAAIAAITAAAASGAGAAGADGDKGDKKEDGKDGDKSEDDESLEEGMIEIGEGETLEEIKARLKPKKSAISIDMLDTANTYDDKVAVIRMLVSEDSKRVASVLKNMIKQ
ncbi:MAG: flagellar basal-body MS-ring/collar protein FliF [Betaproteobacteria bacterium]